MLTVSNVKVEGGDSLLPLAVKHVVPVGGDVEVVLERRQRVLRKVGGGATALGGVEVRLGGRDVQAVEVGLQLKLDLEDLVEGDAVGLAELVVDGLAAGLEVKPLLKDSLGPVSSVRAQWVEAVATHSS